MKRLWLRWLMWWNNICPRHGYMKDSWKGRMYCKQCGSDQREQYSNYLDSLLKEWNQCGRYESDRRR